MRLLGAILAGGTASRFGSDKALAEIDGRPLIAHVADALSRDCDMLVVCGREWGGHHALADQPSPGLGPMGGLVAALSYGRQQGFDAVLSAPCDVFGLPDDLAERLSPGPAVAQGQWLVGLWPTALAPMLVQALSAEGALPARRFVEQSGARAVVLPPFRNINRPGDLCTETGG